MTELEALRMVLGMATKLRSGTKVYYPQALIHAVDEAVAKVEGLIERVERGLGNEVEFARDLLKEHGVVAAVTVYASAVQEEIDLRTRNAAGFDTVAVTGEQWLEAVERAVKEAWDSGRAYELHDDIVRRAADIIPTGAA